MPSAENSQPRPTTGLQPRFIWTRFGSCISPRNLGSGGRSATQPRTTVLYVCFDGPAIAAPCRPTPSRKHFRAPRPGSAPNRPSCSEQFFLVILFSVFARYSTSKSAFSLSLQSSSSMRLCPSSSPSTMALFFERGPKISTKLRNV